MSATRRKGTPPGTAVIQIGAYWYPVLLREDLGPGKYEEIRNPTHGGPLNYSRRDHAVKYLWDRHDNMSPDRNV